MNLWMNESIQFFAAVVSLLASPAFFSLVGCLLLLPAVKLFKTLLGG